MGNANTRGDAYAASGQQGKDEGCFGSMFAAQPRSERQRTHRFQAILDNYSSIEQVQEALRREGLESSNLIVAVDFTASNEWTGKHSFGGKNMHSLGSEPNPYEEAIRILGRTLSAFDDDGLIPAYGFGDGHAPILAAAAGSHAVKGLIALNRDQAVKLTVQSGGQYHILLIVADGQVSSFSGGGQRSQQEVDTMAAITAASQHALSIIMVGVGDGPWGQMKEFDDALPQRRFDNFQFVNFTDIWQRFSNDPAVREPTFARDALMEVPEQFKKIQQLGMLGRPAPLRVQVQHALPPPGPYPVPMPRTEGPEGSLGAKPGTSTSSEAAASAAKGF